MIIEHILQRTIKTPARMMRDGIPIGQAIEDALFNAIATQDSGEEVIEITVKLSEEDRLDLYKGRCKSKKSYKLGSTRVWRNHTL